MPPTNQPAAELPPVEEVKCEACDQGYRFMSDGLHCNPNMNDATWGVCRKLVAYLQRYPTRHQPPAVPLDARERAQKILWTFMQTIDGDRDYSCDKCELTTYLCPHLFERLQNLIAAALPSTPSVGDAIDAKLEEMRACENGMCCHCIDLLLEVQELRAKALQPSTPSEQKGE